MTARETESMLLTRCVDVAREAMSARDQREAVLNAVVHQDYSTGNPIHIKIYNDKVLIFNDGKLPDHWTAEDLLRTHTSRPYNPFIARTFFRSGMIETWGRGIERMVMACEKEGNPPPFYKVSPLDLMIGFHTATRTGEQNDKRSPGKNRRGAKSVGVDFGTNFGTNETQKKILLLMRESPAITAQKLAERLGITKRQIESSLRDLKKRGMLERVGANKNGTWRVLVDVPV